MNSWGKTEETLSITQAPLFAHSLIQSGNSYLELLHAGRSHRQGAYGLVLKVREKEMVQRRQ